MILNCALIWRPYISIETECRWPWHLIDPYAVVLVSYHLHLPLEVGWQTTWATSKPRDRSYSNHDRNYASSLGIITGAHIWALKIKIKGTASKNLAHQPICCQAWWDQRNNNNYRHSTIRLQEIRIKGWESTMKTPVSQPWPSPPRSRSRVQMIAQLDEAVSINVRHCTSFSTADSSPFRKLQPRSKL